MTYIKLLRSEVNVTDPPGARINLLRSEVTVVSTFAHINIFRSEIGTASPVTASVSPSGVTIEPFTLVTLIGGGGNSSPTVQTWTQVSGTPVTINQTGDTATFTAAGTYAGETSVFRYNVDGATADVSVTFYPATEFAIIGGVQVPMQMQLVSST